MSILITHFIWSRWHFVFPAMFCDKPLCYCFLVYPNVDVYAGDRHSWTCWRNGMPAHFGQFFVLREVSTTFTVPDLTLQIPVTKKNLSSSTLRGIGWTADRNFLFVCVFGWRKEGRGKRKKDGRRNAKSSNCHEGIVNDQLAWPTAPICRPLNSHSNLTPLCREKIRWFEVSFSRSYPNNIVWGRVYPLPTGSIRCETRNNFTLVEAQWPIGYGVRLRIKRSSVWIRPWPLHWVLGQGSLLPLSQGEAFTLASIAIWPSL